MKTKTFKTIIAIIYLHSGIIFVTNPESFKTWQVITVGIMCIVHAIGELGEYIVDLFEREEWEYGKCNGKKARRHKKNGNVQFILWHKGDQKEVDGVGHLEDKWHNFAKSHWPNFRPSPLVMSNPPAPPPKVERLADQNYTRHSSPPFPKHNPAIVADHNAT